MVCTYTSFVQASDYSAAPSQRRPGLSPGLVCVGCVVDKVTLGQVFPLSALFRQRSIVMYLSLKKLSNFYRHSEASNMKFK